MYLVDLANRRFGNAVDWNDPWIDWKGRGGDRGLRGIAFHDGGVIAAASDEVFVFDQTFQIVRSLRNQYLRKCHEIFVEGSCLYITSTAYDSILKVDLQTWCFTEGYCIRCHRAEKNGSIGPLDSGPSWRHSGQISSFAKFDPNSENGPRHMNSCHINNVFVRNGCIYFSGIHLTGLFRVDPEQEHPEFERELPLGTHNVRLTNSGLVYNDTFSDRVVTRDIASGQSRQFDIIKYSPEDLLNTNFPKDYARQGFGRGLCLTGNYIIGGSSPSTISVYSIKENRSIATYNLTRDIRNSIHGLEIYPYTIAGDLLTQRICDQGLHV